MYCPIPPRMKWNLGLFARIIVYGALGIGVMCMLPYLWLKKMGRAGGSDG